MVKIAYFYQFWRDFAINILLRIAEIKLKSNKKRLIKITIKKVVDKIENTVGKEALYIINISFDLKEIKKQFDQKGNNSLIIKAVIDL